MSGEQLAEDPSAKKEELTIVEAPASYEEKMEAWEEEEGMFAEDVSSFKEYPRSLHFLKEVTATQPSEKAREFLSELHPLIASKEGHYGAGGGQIHVVYFGEQQEDALSGIGKGIDGIELLKLAPGAAGYSWAFHVDPTHQAMFCRQQARDEEESLLKVDKVARSFCKEVQWPVQAHVGTSYPYFADKAPVLLYARILVSRIHDGDCPSDCPRDKSVYAAVENDTEDYADPGDITESPSFTLMQLEGTNEVFGLVYWDYLD